MKDFIIQNSNIIVFISLLAEFIIFVFLTIKSFKYKKVPYILCCLITMGLFIDTAIIFMGNFLTNNLELLKNISYTRYVLHSFLVPLCIMISIYLVKPKKITLKIWWCLTIVVLVLGVISAFFTDLVLDCSAGMIRFAQGQNTPVWASTIFNAITFLNILPIIICGIIVTIKYKTPYLLLSGLFMLIFSAIAPALHCMDINFILTMFGEIFMVLFMYLAIKKLF